jgi:DNA replication protein DnaC
MRDNENREQCAERRRIEDARPNLVELYTTRHCAAIDLVLARIGIPERALQVARHCKSTKAVQAIDEVGSHGCMILSGGVGCGKTVAAAKWIHDYVVSKNVWKTKRVCNIDDETMDYQFTFLGKAVWVTAAKLARADHYDSAIVAQYTECDRLVIDDLGKEYLDTKGFYTALLDEIVDERYAHMRATVLTTNASDADFKERYKTRIVDRVRETGRFFGCGEESLRKPPENDQGRLAV